MTGITRVSKESIFLDLNNMCVVTTTSDLYATSFGFTEKEVFDAMEAQGIPEDAKEKVKRWYDGFTFGSVTDIYNPWSIAVYLNERRFDMHWANTSGNGLVGHLLKQRDPDVKMKFEKLLKGEWIEVVIDEQIIYDQLDTNRNVIWSLLLAGGYLKVLKHESYLEVKRGGRPMYTLALTNWEVLMLFEDLIKGWFDEDDSFCDFVKAMFKGNVQEMNQYMNDIALTTFSSFDTGTKPSKKAPERFYHGFAFRGKNCLIKKAVKGKL